MRRSVGPDWPGPRRVDWTGRGWRMAVTRPTLNAVVRSLTTRRRATRWLLETGRRRTNDRSDWEVGAVETRSWRRNESISRLSDACVSVTETSPYWPMSFCLTTSVLSTAHTDQQSINWVLSRWSRRLYRFSISLSVVFGDSFYFTFLSLVVVGNFRAYLFYEMMRINFYREKNISGTTGNRRPQSVHVHFTAGDDVKLKSGTW